MESEAGHEASGLRGGFIPEPVGLLLLRDATLSRDSVPIAQSILASFLRAGFRGGLDRDVAPTIIVVAAHNAPDSHAATLRRLGAPLRSETQLIYLDARTPLKADCWTTRSGESSSSTVKHVGDELAVVEELCGLMKEPGCLVFIDSADALLCGVGCDVGSVVRAALGRHGGVIVAADMTSLGLFNVVLEDLADVVLDVLPLTSKAVEYHGRVRIAKEKGRWRREPPSSAINNHRDRSGSFLYRLCDTSVRYFR
jgi:hypothetical protein